METDYSKLDFHKFVDDELAKKGFKIVQITKELMDERIEEFMSFVNKVITEYKDIYGWKPETREYFLNGLVDKWKYSFSIMDKKKDEICFVNFSSVYGDFIHLHCAYGRRDTRNMNFAKLNIIKLCQTGLDNGFKYQKAYWPKGNNRSIILYLRMGWEIESIRNNTELFMKANLEKVRNHTYELVLKERKN